VTRWRKAPPDEPEEDEGPWDPDEPIEVPITEALDLHDFAPREVVPVAEAYLEAAREKGYSEVRLIHGRGKGVQRANLRRMLGHHPDVEAFDDAPSERGGWGATLVRLRPRDTP
jgi:DNA-nicking Smr family endonuclease